MLPQDAKSGQIFQILPKIAKCSSVIQIGAKNYVSSDPIDSEPTLSWLRINRII